MVPPAPASAVAAAEHEIAPRQQRGAQQTGEYDDHLHVGEDPLLRVDRRRIHPIGSRPRTDDLKIGDAAAVARSLDAERRCAELGRVTVHDNKLPFPDIPRF